MSTLSLPASAAALADAGRRLADPERRSLARAVLLASLGLWLVGVLLLEFGLSWTTTLDTAGARPDGGHAYVLAFRPLLGVFKAVPDEPARPSWSGLILLEDGKPLGPAHSLRARIRSVGGGAYSHGQDGLFLSASDDSDIRANGRVYRAKATLRPGNSLRSGIRVAGCLALAAALWLAALNGLALRRFGVLLGAGAACAALGTVTSGTLFVALFSTAGVLGALAAVWAAGGALSVRARLAVEKRLGTLALVLGSLAVGLTLLEAGIRIADAAPAPSAAPAPEIGPDELPSEPPPDIRVRRDARRGFTAMPEAWARRPVRIPGVKWAYEWHGVVHVHDENGMRFDGPIPPRDPAKFRIMVVGDSLTYGEGIAPEWGYPKVLERKLRAAGYAAETVNLGVSGFQSADVRGVVERFYDELKPDLVIYGICQNDFLDSGEAQRDALLLRLPAFLMARSKLAFVFEDRINAAARRLGVSMDFFDDILKDIEHYEPRFARDLAAMNAFVRSRGGPPIVAMVLDQYPDWGGKGGHLTRLAEAAARRAGMDVVGTEGYYRKYAGRNFAVSQWEGHPDEWANEIFALMLYRRVAGCCGMERFKRP